MGIGDFLARQWRSIQASDRAPSTERDTTVTADFRDFEADPVDPFADMTVTFVDNRDPQADRLAAARERAGILAPEDERERARVTPGRGPLFEVQPLPVPIVVVEAPALEAQRRLPGPFFEVETPAPVPTGRSPIQPTGDRTIYLPRYPMSDYGMMNDYGMSGGAMAPLDPVFDARQNVIEACKHLLQAEEHLFRPDRRCPDCVQKHLLLAEGYVDELGSLDRRNQWTRQGRLVLQTTHGALRMLERGVDPKHVAELLRDNRKVCLAATRSFTLERASHARAFGMQYLTRRNLAYAAGALGALWLIKR